MDVFYSCRHCRRRCSPRHFLLIELGPGENVLQQHAECLARYVQNEWMVTDGTTLKKTKKKDLLGTNVEMTNKDVNNNKKAANHLAVIIKSEIIQLQIAHELNYPLT